MMFWLTHPLELQGVLYWAVNVWGGDPYQKAFNGGDGYIFYRDENGNPLPSIRAMIVRDGIDDVDLIHMLKQKDFHHLLLDFSDLAKTPYAYSREAEVILERRKAILQALSMPN